MPTATRWGQTPRASIEAECRRRGRPELVAGCLALLRRDDMDAGLLLALGGPPARWAVSGEAPGPDYWLRVRALRGLLWSWDDLAVPAMVTALGDPAWRVREAAARVAAPHRLDEARAELAGLEADPVARVRAAAGRAQRRLAGG